MISVLLNDGIALRMRAVGKTAAQDPIVGFLIPELAVRFCDGVNIDLKQHRLTSIKQYKLPKGARILLFDSEASLKCYFEAPAEFAVGKNSVPYLNGWIAYVPRILLRAFKSRA